MNGKKLSEEHWQDEVARLQACVNKLEAAQQQRAAEITRDKLLRDFFEQASDGIALVRLDGQFLEVNQAFCNLTGYSQVQIASLHFSDICQPADWRVFQQVLEATHSALKRETFLLNRQGRYIGFILNVLPVSDNSGQTSVISVQISPASKPDLIDTTTPAKTSPANTASINDLHDFYSQVAGIIENVNEAFIALNFSWDIVYVNQYLETMIRQKRAKLLGHKFWEIFPDLFGSAYFQLFQQVLADGLRREFELHFPITNNWYLIKAYRTAHGLLIFTSYDNDRHKAQEGLRVSEERYHALADRMPLMVWTTRPDGWFDYYNQPWFDYTGQTAQAAFGWGWEAVIHPEDLVYFLKTWRRVLQTGEAFEIESRFRRYDGVFRWQLRRALPVRNEAGEIISWIGTFTDIDDQKQAEERLNFQAEVLGQVNDVVVAIDNDLRVTFWNRSAEKVYGLKSEDIIGHPLEEAYVNHWPNKEAEFQTWEIFQAIGSWRGEVTQIKTLNGETIHVEVATSSLKNKDGQKVGMLAVIRDNSERKISDEAVQFLAEASVLLSTSLNYRATLHSLAQLVVPGLADWCYFDLLNEKEVMQRVALAHSDPLKENLLIQLARHYPVYNNQKIQLKNILLNGEPQMVSNIDPAQLMAVAIDEKQAAMWLTLNPRSMLTVPLTYQGRLSGVFTCVSSRPNFFQPWHLRLAQELARRASMAIENSLLFQQTQEALEAQRSLDIAKDQFLSIASHELRTPLTSIRGYVQLLLRKHYANTPQAPSREFEKEGRMLRNLDGQIMRMDDLIGEMLDVTRIENGRLELHYSESTDMVSLVNRLVEQQQEPAAITDQRLVVEVDQTSFYAQVDEARLEQVLNNLITNALKYSPPGSLVLVGLQVAGEGLQIWVRDNGYGIDPQEQANIFKRFYRASTGGDINIDGLGLGLFISHEIVTRHGGRIWFESEPGKGSTFFVWLPLKPPVEPG